MDLQKNIINKMKNNQPELYRIFNKETIAYWVDNKYNNPMIQLYTYYRSSAAYRVRIALHYKNIEHELISVNLLEGKQLNSDYAAVNPQMRVPTFVDNDFVFGQSLAILEYLEEKYPQPALLPKGLIERAKVRCIAQLIASDIHPLNNWGVLQYLKKNFHQDQVGVNEWYFHWLKKGFDALETLLSDPKNPKTVFCYGDSLTMADICLIPQIYNAFRFEFPMMNYPRLLAIYEHCLTLACFDKARPENQKDAI